MHQVGEEPVRTVEREQRVAPGTKDHDRLLTPTFVTPILVTLAPQGGSMRNAAEIEVEVRRTLGAHHGGAGDGEAQGRLAGSPFMIVVADHPGRGWARGRRGFLGLRRGMAEEGRAGSGLVRSRWASPGR